MSNELLERARAAVATAREVGADEAVASVSRSRSVEFSWRDGQLEKVQENASSSLGVRLYVDGRYSTHSTNDLDPARLKHFLAEAVALTRFLEVDPHRRIPDPALYEGRADVDLDLVDPGIDDVSRETRIAWCREMQAVASAHEDVISCTSGVQSGSSVSARVSSNGFEGTSEGTGLYYGVEVTARDGDTRRPAAWRWVGGRHREGIPSPEDVGREGLRRVLARKGARKLPSLRTTLVLAPEAGAPFVGRVFGALGAAAIQQKRSFLADKLDREVASPLFHVRDDPHLPRGLASCLYDGEGIASRPRDVFAEGRLATFFVDTYYGRKLGWKPTAGSTSNLVFRHGERDLAGVLRQVGEGILVTSWMGGNADLTTGDFSFGIQGHRIEGGAVGEPVGEMNVTGNYLDLLRRLELVGNDPEPWSTVRTPTLAFANVQFSGA